MSMLASVWGRRERSSWLIARGFLSLILFLVPGCDDNVTQPPDPEFRADLAFILTPAEPVDSGPSELWAASMDGRVRGLYRERGCLLSSPSISPDGSRLAFCTCGEGGGPDLVVITAEGWKVRRVTGTIQAERNPRWSPDGATIAFESLREGLWVLCVVDADSGAERIVATSASPLSLGDWSVDGTEIAYGELDDLWTVSLSSLVRVPLTHGPGRKRGPCWSPAGDSIAFLNEGRLFLVSRQGGDPRGISVDADSLTPPIAWSYDGQFFLATGWTGGRPDILRIMRDGSSVVNLTRIFDPGRSPVLLPDRRQFAYVADLGITQRIFLMDTEGLGIRPLQQMTLNESSPAARRRGVP